MPSTAALVRERLVRGFNGILLVIAVQFFLGMWLNLFGSFPSGSSDLGSALAYTSDPALVAHIVVALVLIIAGVALFLISMRDGLRMLRWFALGGLTSLVFASLTGSGFVYSGYSSGVDSFLMAVGFAGALTSYYEGLVRMRGNPIPSSSITAPPSIS